VRERILRGAIVALAALSAGWMLFDGTRALIVGDYVTVEGELGPWALLVDAIGVPPRSLAMKSFFVLYGAGWLSATVAFAARRRVWPLMMGFAAGSLWYLVVGTVLALLTIALLLAFRRAGAPRDSRVRDTAHLSERDRRRR
jgi:hypothetical protein